MIAAFHYIHRLCATHERISGREFYVFHHRQIDLIIDFRTQGLLQVRQFNRSSEIVIIQLHIHFVRRTKTTTDTAVH